MNTAASQLQQTQPALEPAAQPQQSQQPQQFQQPASHTQQWAPVIEAHDLVMDYTASMARAQAGHGVTGVVPAGAGAGYAPVPANPAAQGTAGIPGAGQPNQPIQPGFVMPTMHTLALNHVNFVLGEGETVAVMGPSGSGKSTLLHALAGIIKPTAGTVIFRGADLSRMSDAERTKLRRNAFGFVFQSGQLLPELPAVENIALPMMLDGMPYRTATDTAILWLERMGLRALATHRPGEMSGGQMQRIAIARALAVKPAVVFADEPTGALDQATGREVMGILMAAARDNGSAVVVVTHDPNVASFCSRTVTMQDGQLGGIR
ncbi:ABC transporter ATP-binding protein [Bifidobacterium longum]|uniref:ABC transporter ATP-binding protein n=1 Tax=Bifidobacterium longum TaxID=216816 RepID=UPI00118059A8|nr:ABC transporter ATP-binding protein [Bifidobacterium longum]